jgi:hypothetical protein
MGDKLDPKRSRVLAVGDTVTIPLGMAHLWIAKERAEVFLKFLGPFTITYLNPADAPRPRAFPFGY